MVIAAAVIAAPVFGQDEKKLPEWVTGPTQQTHVNDFRSVILPAIKPGTPNPACEETPAEASILRALTPVTRGVPGLYEEFREDLEIVTEKIVDRIDPPRFYPLVGWAQLHHCHFRATVFYTEVINLTYPLPCTTRRTRCETVSIDRDHLHLAPQGSPADLEPVTRDLSGK
jgi:hypothetical protein